MTQETLMTQSTTEMTTEAAPSTPGTEAGTAPAEGTQTQQPPAQAQGESAPADKPAEGQQQDKPQGAPERYEFRAPEGAELGSDVTDAFAGVAKELNLTQDAAQKVLDKMAPVLAQRQNAQVQAVQQEWREQSTADKEFGGDKLAENLGVARKAMDAFASPGLKQTLEQTGLGNHPEVIRMFVKVGKAISQDGFVTGQPGAAQAADPKRFYPNSRMN